MFVVLNGHEQKYPSSRYRHRLPDCSITTQTQLRCHPPIWTVELTNRCLLHHPKKQTHVKFPRSLCHAHRHPVQYPSCPEQDCMHTTRTLQSDHRMRSRDLLN